MAVTIGSAGITFSDGNSQTSRGAVLSNVAYTGYSGVNVVGQQGFQTSVADYYFMQGANANGTPSTVLNTANKLTTANQVWCGMQCYRSGNANTGSADNYQDAGTIQTRMAYRNVS
jgi:hypothetical protein